MSGSDVRRNQILLARGSHPVGPQFYSLPFLLVYFLSAFVIVYLSPLTLVPCRVQSVP